MMYERTVHYVCTNHDVDLYAVTRTPERALLNPKRKGVFCINSALESWQSDIESKYGCTDWLRALTPITEVKA